MLKTTLQTHLTVQERREESFGALEDTRFSFQPTVGNREEERIGRLREMCVLTID